MLSKLRNVTIGGLMAVLASCSSPVSQEVKTDNLFPQVQKYSPMVDISSNESPSKSFEKIRNHCIKQDVGVLAKDIYHTMRHIGDISGHGDRCVLSIPYKNKHENILILTSNRDNPKCRKMLKKESKDLALLYGFKKVPTDPQRGFLFGYSPPFDKSPEVSLINGGALKKICEEDSQDKKCQPLYKIVQPVVVRKSCFLTYMTLLRVQQKQKKAPSVKPSVLNYKPGLFLEGGAPYKLPPIYDDLI